MTRATAIHDVGYCATFPSLLSTGPCAVAESRILIPASRIPISHLLLAYYASSSTWWYSYLSCSVLQYLRLCVFL